MTKPADPPTDIEPLKALLVASEDRNLRKKDRIDPLEKLVANFKRALFGARSEKADLLPGSRLRANDERAEQFELSLEDIETALSAMHASPAGKGWRRSRLKTKRLIRLHHAQQSRAKPTVAHGPSLCRALKRLLNLTARSAAVGVM